jgi:uncharacterized protein (DUF736 family)
MAIIGTFTQNGNGLTGSVKTLTLNAKLRFVPVEKRATRAPTSGSSPAPPTSSSAPPGRRPRRRAGPTPRDPSFPAPIYTALVEAEDGANLIWSR